MKFDPILALVADIPVLPPERPTDESNWAVTATYWGIAIAALALLWFLRRRMSKSRG